MNKISTWFTHNLNFRFVLVVYVIFVLAASLQSYLLGNKRYEEGGKEYTHYNNYVIFKQSHFHLVQAQDLYVSYPDEQLDLFKYSPAFSLSMGILSYLPDAIGLLLWNLLNALALFFGIRYLPKLNDRSKMFMLLFILIELMTSMQNDQSNGMIAGLIVLAFGLLERNKFFLAVLCIFATVFIKIFGIVALALFLFYPKKWKLVLYSFFWFAFFIFIPLVVVDLNQLKFLYNSWLNLLSHDHAVAYGLSVLGWLYTWFGIEVNKLGLIIVGAILFMIPLARFKKYKDYYFRLLALASILLWVVIFNHKAESPTFVIAVSGVGIWYFSQQRSIENLVLLIFVFVLTSLSPTDIFPRVIRNEWVNPFVLKAVPCILVWVKIIFESTFDKYSPEVYPSPKKMV